MIGARAQRVTSKPLRHVVEPVRRLTGKPVQRVVSSVGTVARHSARTVERTTRQAGTAVLEDVEHVGGSVLPAVDEVAPSPVLPPPLPLPVELPAPVVRAPDGGPSPGVTAIAPASHPVADHADSPARSDKPVASAARSFAARAAAPLAADLVPAGQPARLRATATAAARTPDVEPLAAALDVETVLRAAPSSAPASVRTGAAAAAAAFASASSFSPAAPGLAAEWLLVGGTLVALRHPGRDGNVLRLFRQPGFCPD
jgi:hypothetical protein